MFASDCERETSSARKHATRRGFPRFQVIREQPPAYTIGAAPKTNARMPAGRDEWLELPWPATRLTEEHRQMLCVMSNQTRKPMTQILVESIELMYEVFRNEG
jgi:hypothetical protein